MRKVGAKNHCNQYRCLAFRRDQDKSLDAGKCPMSTTSYHSEGIGTCTQSSMAIPSYPSSEIDLGKFPGHTEFQSWIVNFRTEVCSKAKNSTLASQRMKEIETAKSLDDLITSTSIMGNKIPDYEELDLMMAAALKKCYDKHTHFSFGGSVSKSREHQRTTDFSESDKSLI